MSGAPNLIVVMGVSGCGKSSLAKALAQELSYNFVEADHFHTLQAKALMRNSRPLTDAHRRPWMDGVKEHLQSFLHQHSHCVLAHSALRSGHRQELRTLGFHTWFLHLEGDKEVIRNRMVNRTNHYMPASLLDSQYKALESTEFENDVFVINLDASLESIRIQAIELIQNKGEIRS